MSSCVTIADIIKPMNKNWLFVLCACLLCASCAPRAEKLEAQTQRIICAELEKYLLGAAHKVRFAERAARDLAESSWPEAQCPLPDCPSVHCGPLFAPREGTALRVAPEGDNKFVYSVICPCGCHQRFTDFTSMEAYLAADDSVEVRHVVWH